MTYLQLHMDIVKEAVKQALDDEEIVLLCKMVRLWHK